MRRHRSPGQEQTANGGDSELCGKCWSSISLSSRRPQGLGAMTRLVSGFLVAAALVALLAAGGVARAEVFGNFGNANKDPDALQCKLLPYITEENIFEDFADDMGAMWASACGRNRGVFVLDPPDGQTYGCANFPADWGVGSAAEVANADPAVAKEAVSKYISAVFNTSIVKGVEACDFEGLSHLECGRDSPWKSAPWAEELKAPIRAVNIGGLFVLEAWILPGFVEWGEDKSGIIDQYTFSTRCAELGICDRLYDHWKSFYTADDFVQMKQANLNSIRLPVGYWYFSKYSNFTSAPYLVPKEDLYDAAHPITQIIGWANDAGLKVILDLHGVPGSQNGLDNSGQTAASKNNLHWGEGWLYNTDNVDGTVRTLVAIAEYVKYLQKHQGMSNVIALELVNEPWAKLDLGLIRNFYIRSIEAVRAVWPEGAIIAHDSFRAPQWVSLLHNFPYENVYMDSHIYHAFNLADIASSTVADDQLKLYAHEKMACAYVTLLRYTTCAALPVFVGEWSLAVDDCVPNLNPKFMDVGQCDNIKGRLDDPWWQAHFRSFSQRQIATFEREMGWAFWTWRMDDYGEQHVEEAPLWSFRLALQHDLIDTTFPSEICITPPVADYLNAPPPPPPVEGAMPDPDAPVERGGDGGDSADASGEGKIERMPLWGRIMLGVGIVLIVGCAVVFLHRRVRHALFGGYSEIGVAGFGFGNVQQHQPQQQPGRKSGAQEMLQRVNPFSTSSKRPQMMEGGDDDSSSNAADAEHVYSGL